MHAGQIRSCHAKRRNGTLQDVGVRNSKHQKADKQRKIRTQRSWVPSTKQASCKTRNTRHDTQLSHHNACQCPNPQLHSRHVSTNKHTAHTPRTLRPVPRTSIVNQHFPSQSTNATQTTDHRYHHSHHCPIKPAAQAQAPPPPPTTTTTTATSRQKHAPSSELRSHRHYHHQHHTV